MKLPALTDRASADFLVGYHVQVAGMFANLANLLREQGGRPEDVAELEDRAAGSALAADNVAAEARARGFTNDRA